MRVVLLRELVLLGLFAGDVMRLGSGKGLRIEAGA